MLKRVKLLLLQAGCWSSSKYCPAMFRSLPSFLDKHVVFRDPAFFNCAPLPNFKFDASRNRVARLRSFQIPEDLVQDDHLDSVSFAEESNLRDARGLIHLLRRLVCGNLTAMAALSTVALESASSSPWTGPVVFSVIASILSLSIAGISARFSQTQASVAWKSHVKDEMETAVETAIQYACQKQQHFDDGCRLSFGRTDFEESLVPILSRDDKGTPLFPAIFSEMDAVKLVHAGALAGTGKSTYLRSVLSDSDIAARPIFYFSFASDVESGLRLGLGLETELVWGPTADISRFLRVLRRAVRALAKDPDTGAPLVIIDDALGTDGGRRQALCEKVEIVCRTVTQLYELEGLCSALFVSSNPSRFARCTLFHSMTHRFEVLNHSRMLYQQGSFPCISIESLVEALIDEHPPEVVRHIETNIGSSLRELSSVFSDHWPGVEQEEGVDPIQMADVALASFGEKLAEDILRELRPLPSDRFILAQEALSLLSTQDEVYWEDLQANWTDTDIDLSVWHELVRFLSHGSRPPMVRIVQRTRDTSDGHYCLGIEAHRPAIRMAARFL